MVFELPLVYFLNILLTKTSADEKKTLTFSVSAQIWCRILHDFHRLHWLLRRSSDASKVRDSYSIVTGRKCTNNHLKEQCLRHNTKFILLVLSKPTSVPRSWNWTLTIVVFDTRYDMNFIKIKHSLEIMIWILLNQKQSITY